MDHSTQQFAHHLDFSGIDTRPATSVAGCRVYTGYEGPPDRPALVFVPGGYHGAWCFSHYLDYFSQRHIGCYALDLPGHGSLADELTPDIGLEFLSDRLIACIEELGRPVVLAGHSVGAIPAMLAAMAVNPQGLVLLAPSPPGNLPGARALPALPEDALRAAPDPDEVRWRFLAATGQINVENVMARMRPESPRVLNDRYTLRMQVDPDRIVCPGICLEAGRDDLERHPAGQDLAIARFLGIDYQLLDAQPHCMMYGADWQQSAEAILVWYQRCFGVGSC